MRIYDPRIVKFVSVDPLTEEYPELTPYQFASNTPVWAIDLDGLEAGYTTPQQVFYDGCAGISEGVASAWDTFTGLFVSKKTEVEVEKTKTVSTVTTNEWTLNMGGSMLQWVRGGRYSSNNTMPTLKLSNVFDVNVKTETKVEVKTKVEAGNVKVESKVNVADGSTEVKGTVKIPANQVTKVPLKISASSSQNNTTGSTKKKVEVNTDGGRQQNGGYL